MTCLQHGSCSWPKPYHQGILSSPCNEWRGYTLQPAELLGSKFVATDLKIRPAMKSIQFCSMPDHEVKSQHPKCFQTDLSPKSIWLRCKIFQQTCSFFNFNIFFPRKALPFFEYFKPINYARSTGIGSTIMGIALMIGMLVTPYAETTFG